jgi:hypothetical protein
VAKQVRFGVVAFEAAIYIRQVIAGVANVAQDRLATAPPSVTGSSVALRKFSGRLIYETAI